MTRLALGLFLCLATAAPAAARDYPIRSGEHADFIRLVLPYPSDAAWRLARTDDGYALVLPSETDTFDVSDVFVWIKRDRLERLSTAPGRLNLHVACEPCHAEAFTLQGAGLVIDLKDGAAPPGSIFEAPLDSTVAPEDDADQSRSAVPLLPVLFDDRLAPEPREPSEERNPNPATSADETRNREDGLGQQTAERRAAMLHGVSRAAAQGLLDPNPDASAQDRQPDPPPAIELPKPPTVTAAPISDVAQAEPMPQPGLVARSGFDHLARTPGAETGGRCLDPGEFDLAAWSDPEAGYAAQHAALSEALAGEFGRTDPEAVEALARFYVHHGFGREAGSVLDLDARRSGERRLLRVLAQLVDGTPTEDRLLSEQAGCPGPVALWSALAAGNLTALDATGQTAALIAYRALPDALRGHLGTSLAQLFLEAGDPHTADEILNHTAPEITGETVDAGLARAEVTNATDGPTAAIAEMAGMAREDARLTPDGLLRLLDLSLQQGETVPDDLYQLLGAMRFEHRNTPVEADLVTMDARILIARGEYDAALSLLDATASLELEERSSLRSEAVLALSREMPDAEFLSWAFHPVPTEISAAAENALAARLTAMGFPERAMDLLAPSAQGADQAERRYLRAEAGLALGNRSVVEAALAGLVSPRAAAIRAEFAAAELAGVPAAPPEAMSSADTEPNRLAAEDSLSTVSSDAPPLSWSAPLAPSPASADDRGVLELGRALLDDAETTGAAAAALLSQRLPAPAE